MGNLSGHTGGNGDEEDEGAGIFADINITPLTDVFLVMVIIFMVSALAVQAEAQKKTKIAQAVTEKAEADKRSGLKVNLPSGAAQEIDPSKSSIVITVPVQGDVQVQGRNVSDSELDTLFHNAFAHDPTTQVVLSADKDVAHGRVVGIMERAKQAGLTRLAIGTGG